MVDIDKKICNYIANEWVSKAKTKSSFAIDHNIDEKTVRKIVKEKEGYRIPVKTLYKICEAREIKISEFFKMIGE
ncbi:helix-turn-helix domain-containing protein [Seonamhaeicola sp.]|uniref:helix-turn-helix domain-containing protein n=1 Tax=Seonamhaeicola sp. TaxID=1912245 RepID=UPI002602DAFE|nr:helix-turn-helix domain-containing protein [Seonamhaeicola sp.]